MQKNFLFSDSASGSCDCSVAKWKNKIPDLSKGDDSKYEGLNTIGKPDSSAHYDVSHWC